jgi:hypothetical protein
MAAPVGDVTSPMRCGYFGSGRFRSGANKPFRRELLLEFLERDLQRADALHSTARTMSWYCPRAS